MAANTPKNITYPTGGDNVDNLQSVFATMATSIDTALGNYIPTSSLATVADLNAGTSTTKVVTPKSLTDAGLLGGGGDTGWVDISGSITAGAGFAKMGDFLGEARRIGNVVQISLHRFEKTASNPFNIPTSGNVGNRLLLSGIPAQFRPSRRSALPSDATGRMANYIIWPDGTVQITAVVPISTQPGTVACPTGEQFSCAGTYFA